MGGHDDKDTERAQKTRRNDRDHKPLAFDIDAIIAEVQAYRDALDNALTDDHYPGFHFGGQRFLDYILAIENVEARGQSKPPLNGHYFENIDDLVRYLQKISIHPEPSQFSTWRGITRGETRHTEGYEIHSYDGKNIVIMFESIGWQSAAEWHQHLESRRRAFPQAIYKAGALVLDIQKESWSCPSCSIEALKCASVHRDGLDSLVDELLQKDEKQETLIVNDPMGNLAHFSFFMHAQSQAQVHGILDNPTWQNEDKELRHAFLQHHLDCRVTQLTHGTSFPQLQTYSNSIDRAYVQSLDRVVTYLKNLKQDHPEEAGRIFADELAKVWPSRPYGWQRQLPTAWSEIESLTPEVFNVWNASHPCWQFPTEKRIQVIKEALAAIKTWAGPSLLRKQILAQVAAQTNIVIQDLQKDETPISKSGALQLLSTVPALITSLVPDLEQTELLDLFSLHWNFSLQAEPDVALQSLQQVSEVMSGIADVGLRTHLLTHLKVVAMAVSDRDDALEGQYAVVFASGIKEVLKLAGPTSSDRLDALAHFLASPRSDFFDKSRSIGRQLEAVVELALNVDEKTLDHELRQASSQESPGDFVAAVQRLSAKTPDDWRNFKRLSENAQLATERLPPLLEPLPLPEPPPPPPPGGFSIPLLPKLPPATDPVHPQPRDNNFVDLESRYPTSKFRALQRRLDKLLQRLNEQLSDDEHIFWKQEQQNLATLIINISQEHFKEPLFPLSREPTTRELLRNKEFDERQLFVLTH